MDNMTSSPPTASGAGAEVSISSAARNPPPKKRRNLPGMPDPNAVVISLSPQSLMATNRFVCEVCSKGFQRDQNLQLHRRGHNLPWRLKQRNSEGEMRRKVYVCPEPSCIHHNPSRALGDLTGIKKHYSRKHGEKKWKCDRCSKKYAVKSDCKAHMKTCGTREYKCDCGTLFSRRDSFITHRAFCDALAEENTKVQTAALIVDDTKPNEDMVVASSPTPPSPVTPAPTTISPLLSFQSPDLTDNSAVVTDQSLATLAASSNSSRCTSYISGKISVFASIFAPSTETTSTSFSHFMSPLSQSDHPLPPSSPKGDTGFNHPLTSPSLYLTCNSFAPFPMIPDLPPDHHHYASRSHKPIMSATALLQKAAQMGATTSAGSSLLCGFSLAMPSSSSSTHQGQSADTSSITQWSSHAKADNSVVTAGLRLGLGFPASDLYVQPTTLDLLGLTKTRH
uniref:C2H2-type domain-containing protein n=1 Tax=Kalanchoe fedtschenkoi TaxID=63787 RepID=A0A7N0UMW8_KALFE